VTIMVRLAGFVTRSRSHTGPRPFASEGELQAEVRRLLEPFFDGLENPKGKKIRLIGVRVEKLVRDSGAGTAQSTLAVDASRPT
jgi:nucleotidyltransferase/DNA polymerase involved in DNA repair